MQRSTPIKRTMVIFIYVRLQSALSDAMTREDGQGLTEYALILALIAIVAIASLRFLGGRVTSALSEVGSSI